MISSRVKFFILAAIFSWGFLGLATAVQEARASAVELQNHLVLAKDLQYLPNVLAAKLFDEATEIIMELNGLIKSTGQRSTSD